MLYLPGRSNLKRGNIMETVRFTPEVSGWSPNVWFIHDSGGNDFSANTHLKAETYFILNGDRPWLEGIYNVKVNLHNALVFPDENSCQTFIDDLLSEYSGT